MRICAAKARRPGPLGGRLGGRCEKLVPQILELVAELGRVFEAELLRGREHSLLERHDELLELVRLHPFDLATATTPTRNGRGFERQELGDVGDALDDRLGRDAVLLVVAELDLAAAIRLLERALDRLR